MRKLFLATWAAAVFFLLWCHWHQQPALAVALAPGEFETQAALLLGLPWLLGPALSPLLARLPTGGLNLPHAAYWFAGERRTASLQRLAGYRDLMAVLLMLFLASLLGLDVWHGQQGLRTPQNVQLAATGVFLLATVVWTLALLRAFPDPKRR